MIYLLYRQNIIFRAFLIAFLTQGTNRITDNMFQFNLIQISPVFFNLIKIINQLRRKMDGPSPRICKEVDRFQNGSIQGMNLQPDPLNFRHFFIELQGPQNSCYAGGLFKLQMLLPLTYPMDPPRLVFNTKIYHPNVDKLGRICLGIIKRNWSPALSINSIIITILAILSDPCPDQSFESQVVQHWRANRKEAEEKAREFTKKYAM